MSKELISQQKSTEDIRRTILTNVVKMLTYRGWINRDIEAEVIQKLVEKYSDTLVYSVDLNSGDKYMIKFTGQKVTTVNNVYGLKDFLHTNKNHSNIVIAKSINDRVLNQINMQYHKTEVFTEDELMIDLSSSVYFPKHEKVIDAESEDDLNRFIEMYNLSSRKKLPMMLRNDPGARYLNLKRGDIVRVLRPSETAGIVPFYRVIV